PYLEDRHVELAERVADFCARSIAPLPEPDHDDAARARARERLGARGRAGWFDPIAARDLRALCLIREALAYASPLADAVFALQALSVTPMLLAAGGPVAAPSGSSPGDVVHAGSGAPSPLAGSAAAGEPDGGPGDAAAATSPRDRWAPAALRGAAMGAFAMTEPDAGSDVAALRTTARRDGDHYVLNGVKTFSSNAGIADFYTVFASTDPERRGRGISCFVVPADTPGLRFVRPLVLSAPHPLGEIACEECRVPAAWRLGEEGEGYKLGLATLDRLRPTVAAAACGMAARALDEALAHATTRHQFGQPLASFQLVQDKLARMATELAAARLLVYRAAWEADHGAARTTKEAAMAKAFATEAAQRIVDEAVQILGGRGVLADHPVDQLYRAVRALRIYEGTTEIQHLIIARHLIERATSSPPDPGAAPGHAASSRSGNEMTDASASAREPVPAGETGAAPGGAGVPDASTRPIASNP